MAVAVAAVAAVAGEPPINVVQTVDPATGADVGRIMSVEWFLPLFQVKLGKVPPHMK